MAVLINRSFWKSLLGWEFRLLIELNQNETLSFCMVGNDQKHIDQALQSTSEFIESNYPVQILNQQMEFL